MVGYVRFGYAWICYILGYGYKLLYNPFPLVVKGKKSFFCLPLNVRGVLLSASRIRYKCPRLTAPFVRRKKSMSDECPLFYTGSVS